MSEIFERKSGMIELVSKHDNMTRIIFYPSDYDSESAHSLSGKLYEAVSWGVYDGSDVHEMNFIADVSIKWDGCSHYWFYGEDYIDEGEKDSYYHLCGVHSYLTFMRSLVFAYEIMIDKVGEDAIGETEEIAQLRKLGLLDGYEIRKIQ